jgi:GMC oxidoreductase
MTLLTSLPTLETYDLVVVGSGNGACAFLRQYLATNRNQRVLVLEEGRNFFDTSEITHQRNWTQSYAEGDIFLLHDAKTPDGLPILSGRACTMGGGGSINYTMIYESSAWLSQNFGHSEDYWNDRKQELADAFQLLDPHTDLTPVARHVQEKLLDHGYIPNRTNAGYIPEYQEGIGDLLHVFPTQFDEFGQRVHSGVSLVSWTANPQLDLLTEHRVIALQLEANPKGGQQCVGLTVVDRATGTQQTLTLGAGCRLLLCAGAGTPKLLLPHREALANPAIGKYVNDHILLPFGIYLLPKDLRPTAKDQYVSMFATSEQVYQRDDGQPAISVGNVDVFSGPLSVLDYLLSHLFLAFWVPNGLKQKMIRNPWVFLRLKRITRLVVLFFDRLLDLLWCLHHPDQLGHHRWNLITAIVKFSIVHEGEYEPDPSLSEPGVLLRCFEPGLNGERIDSQLAENFLTRQLSTVASLGNRPNQFFIALIRYFTRMPYKASQVHAYVEHYRLNNLLTEQHLSGGCLLGEALDPGLDDPALTGLVKGSENIFVADLSASPLPRVSPQMTAYLLGYHVAYQHGRSQRDSQ